MKPINALPTSKFCVLLSTFLLIQFKKLSQDWKNKKRKKLLFFFENLTTNSTLILKEIENNSKKLRKNKFNFKKI